MIILAKKLQIPIDVDENSVGNKSVFTIKQRLKVLAVPSFANITKIGIQLVASNQIKIKPPPIIENDRHAINAYFIPKRSYKIRLPNVPTISAIELTIEFSYTLPAKYFI